MNLISMININEDKKAPKGLSYEEKGMARKDRGYAEYENLEYNRLKRQNHTGLQMELLRNYLR